MIRTLLWWLGMLMYGMSHMEFLIKKSMKLPFQKLLHRFTKNKRSSWGLGVTMTWITQSSSLVSLLVVVFVWAWLFTLQSGIAAIIGANIGTTFSSLLIALIWFGNRSITVIAFPLIAIWGLGSLFVPSAQLKRIGGILLSLGLIFLWIDFLKESVEMVTTTVDLVQYEARGIIWFFIVWVILTVIIQSSHTVVILWLTAVYSGLITPEMALGILIWSNIGTTVTVLIASIWWSRIKRLVAWSHLGFNCILSIIGLLYYQPLYQFSQWIVGSTQNLTIALAVFNTLINTATTLIVMPFLWQFMHHIERIFPINPSGQWLQTASLSSEMVESWSATNTVFWLIDADSQVLQEAIYSYFLMLFGYTIIDSKVVIDTYTFDNDRHKERYIKCYEGLTHIDSLLQDISGQELTKKETKILTKDIECIDEYFDILEGAKEMVGVVPLLCANEKASIQSYVLALKLFVKKWVVASMKGNPYSKKKKEKIPTLSFDQINDHSLNHHSLLLITQQLKKIL